MALKTTKKVVFLRRFRQAIPVAIILVLAGLSLVLLIKFQAVLRSSAGGNVSPLDMFVTDLKKDSVTLVYRTDIPVNTFVKYGLNGNFDQVGVDVSGNNSLYTHRAVISGLQPGANYGFEIGNQKLNVQMPPIGNYVPLQAKVVSGSLTGTNSFIDSVVVLSVNGKFFSTRATAGGSWVITWVNNYKPDGTTETLYPITDSKILIFQENQPVASLPIDWGVLATINAGPPPSVTPVTPENLSWFDQLKKIFFTFVPH